MAVGTIYNNTCSGAIVEYLSKPIENSVDSSRRESRQNLPALTQKVNCHLDWVLGRRSQEKRQQLQSKQFVYYLLVDQMSNKLQTSFTLQLLIPFKRLLELQENAV